MTHIKVEQMTMLHLDGVENIEKECFFKPWSKKSLMEELEQPNSAFFVATDDDKVVGYTGLINIAGEGNVTRVAVLKEYQNQGVGSLLMQEMTEFGKGNLSFITLEVRETNVRAIALYSKYGFKKVGKRKDFYQNPKEDAILMTKYFVLEDA